MALYRTCEGESLHDSLATMIKESRMRGEFCAGFRFLPGTLFTNGENFYEVVYGYQSLSNDPAGWVAAIRTDYVDTPVPEDKQNYAYSLFSWEGISRDGALVLGGKKASILRMVKAAPRVFSV
jgi:hypothetical protein